MNEANRAYHKRALYADVTAASKAQAAAGFLRGLALQEHRIAA
jgi:hypothetical protein